MSAEPAWHEKYPNPQTEVPKSISKEDFLSRLKAGEKAGVNFLIVDLRRNDYEGGTIRGSINLPAQTLYLSLKTLLNLCKAAGVQDVIWYCGSSRGRGTRAACWFADTLVREGVTSVQSMILEGGIKGWARGGEQYVEFMDEYDERAWHRDS